MAFIRGVHLSISAIVRLVIPGVVVVFAMLVIPAWLVIFAMLVIFA
jgi:hypothetical protein